MKTLNQIREGDILLVAVNKMPPEGLKTRRELVLAEGELTGHAHRISGTLVEWTENNKRFFRIVGANFGELSHEDHDPTPVAVIAPETTYRIIPQQEWDLSGQWREVVD